MDSLIGSVGITPLTHLLSFHFLEANSKSEKNGPDPQPPEPATGPGLSPLVDCRSFFILGIDLHLIH